MMWDSYKKTGVWKDWLYPSNNDSDESHNDSDSSE